jgi:hypothetical protein
MSESEAAGRMRMKMKERSWLVNAVGFAQLVTTDNHSLDQWDACAILTADDASLQYLQQDGVEDKLESGNINIIPALSPLGEKLVGQCPISDEPPIYVSYVGEFDEYDGEWLFLEDD